jgi:hypothetical protein
MANERTARLVKAADSSKRLNSAIRARRRLFEEGKKLHLGIRVSRERLTEIDEEEEVLSAAIEEHGGEVAAAHAEPSEAEVSGSHS